MFAEEYVKNGYNGSKAYKVAYGQEDRKICASEAYKLLRDPRILDEIENVEGSFRVIGQAAGIDKKTIVKSLAEMITATKDGRPDHSARKDGITLFAKLTGDFKERKEIEIKSDNETDIDPTKITDEERKKLEKDLIDEL